MNTGYLIAGIALVLLGTGRLIMSDGPGTAVRQTGRALQSEQVELPGAFLPVRFLKQVLRGAALILVGAGAVAGAWGEPAPGRLNDAAAAISGVLFCAGIALIIGHSYLGRQPWLRNLAARLFIRKADGAQAVHPEGGRGVSRSPRFQYIAMLPPRERIRRLLAGVIMSVMTALILLIGLSDLLLGLGDPARGVVFVVVGGIGVLFFVPVTIYALVGAIGLRQRP